MGQERRICILIVGLKGYQCRFYRSKEKEKQARQLEQPLAPVYEFTDQENPLPLRQKLGSFVAPVWLV